MQISCHYDYKRYVKLSILCKNLFFRRLLLFKNLSRYLSRTICFIKKLRSFNKIFEKENKNPLPDSITQMSRGSTTP